MIQLSELTLLRGASVLFENASLSIHRGWKTALVGANGCGKSSFFELIRGHLQADAGSITLTPDLVIASVAQETFPSPAPAINHVLDGDAELSTIETALAGASGTHLAELHTRYAAIDGYSARSRAAKADRPGSSSTPAASASWPRRTSTPRGSRRSTCARPIVRGCSRERASAATRAASRTSSSAGRGFAWSDSRAGDAARRAEDHSSGPPDAKKTSRVMSSSISKKVWSEVART